MDRQHPFDDIAFWQSYVPESPEAHARLYSDIFSVLERIDTNRYYKAIDAAYVYPTLHERLDALPREYDGAFPDDDCPDEYYFGYVFCRTMWRDRLATRIEDMIKEIKEL